MKEITDELSIETWQKIAYFVQKLEVSNCGWQEYEKNLNTLKYLLKNLGISPYTGSRYPHHKKEVGVSTLLQAIYDIYDLKERKNKSLFYEQIYTLADLGIEKVEYRPIDFYTQVLDMKKVYYTSEGITIYDKTYTDGTFELETTTTISKKKQISNYDIVNLQNVNFILNIVLEKEENNPEEKKIILKEASASLKNFKGRFPCKEEVLKDSFPTIMIPEQLATFDGRIGKIKETYTSFNSSDLSCARRLVKNENGWYYSK